MTLDLTPEQRMMRDEARRFLAESASSQQLRRIVDSGRTYDRDLWIRASQELGWCGVTIAERHGGLGLGMRELTLLLEECGMRLAKMPLWATTCLATPLLALCKTEEAESLLARIATAGVAATASLPLSGASLSTSNLDVSAQAADGAYRLTGRVTQVIDLPAADIVLVPARIKERFALFALTPGQTQHMAVLETLDQTACAGTLVFDAQHVPASSRIDDGALTAAQIEQAFLHANLGLAAEQIGTAKGALDLTLAYIAERVQFGRAIASFQAVKHRCAKLTIDIAEARSLVYGAAAALDMNHADAALEISCARALASETQFMAAREAIQLHGGVGCTWEYDPHLYLKRAQASAALLGGADEHLAHVAALLLDQGAAA